MWKILVVDDESSAREVFEGALSGKAVCDKAVSGKEALKLYYKSLENNSPYDLILLDVSMPDMGGMEVLNKIREKEAKGEGVPVIMISAHVAPVFKAFKRGCDDYLVKPVSPLDLIKKIEEKLAKNKKGETDV